MDMKEILKQSLRDGVNQFIDSTINQFDEQSAPPFEMQLKEHLDTLEQVQDFLSMSRYVIKHFNKNFDAIWEAAMWRAVVLNGNDVESMEFEEINNLFQQHYGEYSDLSGRWNQAKIFLTNLRNDETKEYHKYLSVSRDLSEECRIFYYTMLYLKDWHGGFFITKKRAFKKHIDHCLTGIYSACLHYQDVITYVVPIQEPLSKSLLLNEED